MEEKKEEKVRISVRNLVEFILREGDLDSRQGGTTDKGAMLLGGRIHRKIQRQMGGGYHAEARRTWAAPRKPVRGRPRPRNM